MNNGALPAVWSAERRKPAAISGNYKSAAGKLEVFIPELARWQTSSDCRVYFTLPALFTGHGLTAVIWEAERPRR